MQNHSRSPVAGLCRSVLPLLLTAAAADVPAAVYAVGSGSACTHTSLAAAITSAAAVPGTDTIRVARNATHTALALVIDNHSVTIEGGYSSCSDTTQDGAKTVLSGAGGSTTSVITVVGTASVGLSWLEITGGDETIASFGGGIDFSANGTLHLERVLVIDNVAGYGAGINIDGRGRDTDVIIGDEVAFSLNDAVQDGGGVYCRDATITALGRNITALLNTAGSEGGGWYLQNCTASLGTHGGAGLASGNTAGTHGGGFHLRGSSDVQLYSDDESGPVRIVNNRAGGDGGGVALYTTARLRGWEVDIADNTAERGGGVFLTSSAEIRLRRTLAGAPAAARRCSGVCGRIVDNVAETAEGDPGPGAAFALVALDKADQATAFFYDLVFSGNAGASLIFSDTDRFDGPADTIWLGQVLVHSNEASGNLIVNDVWNLQIDYATFADNTYLGGLLNVCAQSFSYSVVSQPGRPLHNGNCGLPHDLAVRTDGAFTGLPASPTIAIVDDLRFVDPAGGDYRLRADSPAVDFAAPSGTPSVDIGGNPRVRDLSSVPNQFGALDLGAYETADCRLADTVFCDGFGG